MSLITRLRNWSVKNDKFAHFLLSFFLTLILGWKFSSGFLIAIECTQADIFGIKDRITDTIFDLTFDFLGLILAILIKSRVGF